MRKRVVNKIGSPYDIMTANGPAVIPAMGEVVADFTDEQIEQMQHGWFDVFDDDDDDDKPRRGRPPKKD